MKLKCSSCGKKVEILEITPTLCPHCSVKFWDKPKNERILHTYQEEYLVTRDEKILGKMALMMQSIIKNLTYKKLKQSGSYDKEEELEDVVYESLLKVLSYYQTKESFKIENSFVGYLSQVILYPLYNAKKKERQSKEISLNAEFKGSSEGGKALTLEDKLAYEYDPSVHSTEEYFFHEVHENDLVTSLSDFLEEIFYTISIEQGLRNALLNWSLLNHYLNGKPERFFNMCLSKYDNCVRDNYENTKVLLREYIMDEHGIKDSDLE